MGSTPDAPSPMQQQQQQQHNEQYHNHDGNQFEYVEYEQQTVNGNSQHNHERSVSPGLQQENVEREDKVQRDAQPQHSWEHRDEYQCPPRFMRMRAAQRAWDQKKEDGPSPRRKKKRKKDAEARPKT